MIIYSILKIAGSLGLFLYGMKVMSDGIQKTAGDRLQKVLNYMTINRFAAALTGFVVTTLVQSSSATTVMVVSFVNAGLLSLTQSIGVIMGANIGTTVTGWIVALIGFKFSIVTIALPAIGIGLPLVFSKRLGKQDLGEVLIGFGILFLGLDFLKGSVPDIKHHPEYLEFLAHFADWGFLSFILFVAVGAVLTIVIQSSSASMAITLTMAYTGWIDYNTAAAVIIGSNIGTTVTAYLASIGANTNAKRASRAHILFNLLGGVLITIFHSPFLRLVDIIIPGDPTTGASIPEHLAMFHTLFNIANTAVFIWFIPQLAKLVEYMVPESKDDFNVKYEFKYISTGIQDTAELNLMKAKSEISKMAGITGEMFSKFEKVVMRPEDKLGKHVRKVKDMEDFTDQMQEQITFYLIECSSEGLNENGMRTSTAMIRIVNELESIGDSCYNLILASERRYNKEMVFPSEALDALKPMIKTVKEFIEFIKANLDQHLSESKMQEALKLEAKVDKERKTLKKESRKRIQKGSDVKTELLYLDIVKHIEHIGDYALNIAEALKTNYEV
ncbi:MAG: Na/Pi cotransporter family protein [Spirochaetales bacterium]|uniref:Na/Pi cotransporter family protein n=1 Tax=Candidatus Thalassospirochaeta sargassi TaxID=3119039 RepID=A0AAJ1MK39_9SPIO|nr:Na/Pi cotransporter family protein [Spirochaetales bacterium]